MVKGHRLTIILGDCSYAFILPAWNGFLAQVLPSSARAGLYSMIISIESFGIAVGPIIGGKLGVAYGFHFAFGVSAVALFVMAVFYLLLRHPASKATTAG